MKSENQTDSMMNSWLDAQQQWVESWSRMMQPVVDPFLNGITAANPFLPGAMGQWQEAVNRSTHAVNDTSAATAQAVSNQLLVAQKQMLQLVQMVTEAWKALAAAGKDPSAWQRDLERFTEQARSQMMDAYAGNLGTGSAVTQLWQQYLAEMTKLAMPWQTVWQNAPAAWGAPNVTTVADIMTSYVDANLKAFDESYGRFLTAPTLGLNRNWLAQLNQGFKVWMETRALEYQYQLMVSDAWAAAFRALMEKLVVKAQEGKSVESLRELVDLWVEVADSKFFDLFHSDEFAALQGKYLNSSMALKRTQRELLEIWLRANDLPTRSDLDEAHRELYNLRKEVKALKKSLDQMAAATANGGAGFSASERAANGTTKRTRKPRRPNSESSAE